MSRTRIVVGLWVVAIALALALAIVFVADPGFWKTSHPDSPAAVYVRRVNQLEQQMQAPLSRLLEAYRRFSKGSGSTKVDSVVEAEKTLRTFERRLQAIPSPPEAVKLRGLILRFVQAEDRVATEIVSLARFTPRFNQLLAVTAAANAQLSKSLSAAKPPIPHAVTGTTKQIKAARAAYDAEARRALAEQADAIDRYDLVVAVTLRGLAALDPPPVMAPAYDAQVQTLGATRKAGAALAGELRKNRRDVPELSRRFTEASRLSGSLAVQRAEIAAVKSYDGRVHEVTALARRISKEMARLQRVGA